MWGKRKKVFGEKVRPSERYEGKYGYKEDEEENRVKETLRIEEKALEISSNIIIVEQGLSDYEKMTGKKYVVIELDRQMIVLHMEEIDCTTFEELDTTELEESVYVPDYVIASAFRNEGDLETLKDCIAIVWAKQKDNGDYYGVPIRLEKVIF